MQCISKDHSLKVSPDQHWHSNIYEILEVRVDEMFYSDLSLIICRIPSFTLECCIVHRSFPATADWPFSLLWWRSPRVWRVTRRHRGGLMSRNLGIPLLGVARPREDSNCCFTLGPYLAHLKSRDPDVVWGWATLTTIVAGAEGQCWCLSLEWQGVCNFIIIIFHFVKTKVLCANSI